MLINFRVTHLVHTLKGGGWVEQKRAPCVQGRMGGEAATFKYVRKKSLSYASYSYHTLLSLATTFIIIL